MTAPELPRRPWRYALGWPFRIACLAALGLLAAALCTEVGAAGTAHARKEMLAVGAEMLRTPETTTVDQGQRVLLNGAELRLRRGRSARSVGELLAAVESSCASAAVLRGGDERRGFVACAAPAGRAAMALPIAYTYAERRGESTHFISFRGDERVDLRAMFPPDQDAPGRDPAALPRPRSSRRALSLQVAEERYEAVVYLDRERGLDDLVSHYREALPDAGWSVVATWRVDEGPGPRQASVVVQRAGVLALLLVAQDRAGTVSTTFMTMETNREQ